MSHTVILNFTKIQEHCISLKNRHLSHMVFLNFSIESLLKKTVTCHILIIIIIIIIVCFFFGNLQILSLNAAGIFPGQLTFN